MNLISFLVCFFTLIESYYATKSFNMTSFRRMPRLYEFDQYDSCRKSSQKSLAFPDRPYCIVYAEISSDPSNSLWHEIHDHSLDIKRHFRHDHLYYGVCLERCKHNINNNNDSLDSSYIADIKHNELKDFYEMVYGRAEDQNDDRRKYARLVNECLNEQFGKKYNLSLETFIEYCVTDNSHNAPKTRGERDLLIGLRGTVAFIGIMVVFCSIYDLSLKLKEPKVNRATFYKTKLESRSQIILTSFSICRNYYRLTMPEVGRLGRDLKFLDGLRSNAMFIVVSSHIIPAILTSFIANPERFESYFHSKEVAFNSIAMTLMQLFFCISAFLFYVQLKHRNIVTKQTSLWQTMQIGFKLYTYRYLRLIPSVMLIVLISTAIYSGFELGPMWRHVTAPEQQLCRTTWWKQLLLLNSNFLHKQSCVQQTWYISTDLQLYQIFLLITLLSAKYPILKKPLFTLMFLISCLVPAFVTYFLEMEGTSLISVESIRYTFLENKEFHHSYIPFYMNMSSYLFGILAGEMYLKTRTPDTEKKPKRNLFFYKPFWWLLIPVAYGLQYSGIIFYDFDFPKPSIISAVYAGLFRPMCSFVFAALILGMCHKIGGFIYDYFSLSMFRVMSRISYQTYLWHIIIIRFLIGSYHEPIAFSNLFYITMAITVYVMANILGLFLTLCFEYPITTIARVFYDVKRAPITASQDVILDSTQVSVAVESSSTDDIKANNI